MGLSGAKILKGIEKNFSQTGNALQIAEPGEQEQCVEKIRRLVEAFDNANKLSLLKVRDIKVYRHDPRLDLYNPKTSVIFSVQTSYLKPRPDIVFSFNDQNHLIIETYDNNDHHNTKSGPFLCRDLDHIGMLLGWLKTAWEKANKADTQRKITAETNAQKHEKIKGLKYSAIMAKIKEFTAEANLTYALVSYSTKMKFLIQLSPTEMFEIDIPYKNFQSVLQNLKTAVAALFDLRAKGITITHKRFTAAKAPIWSYHD